MKNLKRQRLFSGLLSVVVMVALYTFISNAYRVLDLSVLPESVNRVLQPKILPPTQMLLDAFIQLIGGQTSEMSETHIHMGERVSSLLQQNVTLQGSLLISTYRMMVGLCVGATLGILTGLFMGWSRKVDEYVHPIYILLRSIPPLALITYVMLWFGHGEAHLLIPIVYAVFTTVVIPTYHGVRDIADIYVKAARSLGAGGRLLFSKVVLPAASPFVLSGLRYSLIIAWMTTVGVEMLMGENGIGNLLVGGGLWTSRLTVGVDPAVVMVGILGLAMVGYLMDTAARILTDRLTLWKKEQKR